MEAVTVWLAHYRCGCTEEAARKAGLVGYCGIHGEGLLEPLIRLPGPEGKPSKSGRRRRLERAQA